jgi:hypothetical protein
MGTTFSYTKIHNEIDNEIDNEVDYQAYQARLKRKERCIKNFQPHIDFLIQEYKDLCDEIDSYDILSKDYKYLSDLYERRRWNRKRQIQLYEELERL